MPVPTTVSVSPGSATLQALAETVQLNATVKDQDGQTMQDVDVSWTSGNPSVATVSVTGLVTATANGTATVEASVEDLAGTADVTVEQEVAEVRVSPETAMLVAFGDTIHLSAEAADANGHLIEGAGFAWSSNDESVATVDGAGVVTAVSDGAAAIVAAAGGEAAASDVTVEQQVAQVIVSPDPAVLDALADTVRLSAAAADANGNVMEGVDFTWSSSDELVVRVDAAGLVTAVGKGMAEVAAAAAAVTGFAAVRVEPHRRPLLTFYPGLFMKLRIERRVGV